jgi:hypothetical protein
MKMKKWPRVPNLKKNTGLSLHLGGRRLHLKKNFAQNSKGFILNENEEMVKSFKR